MKEGRLDKVFERASAKLEKIGAKVDRQFKDIKPFQQEFVTDDKLIEQYDSMTPDMWQVVEAKLGRQGMANFITSMENLKRQKYGG